MCGIILLEDALKMNIAPLAQLDRALPSGGKGQRFESSKARHSLRSFCTKRIARPLRAFNLKSFILLRTFVIHSD